MAKKTKDENLKLNSYELALLQRNVMARELREVKISVLDDQISKFDHELREMVIQRLGVDIAKSRLNTMTGEITKAPNQKVG